MSYSYADIILPLAMPPLTFAVPSQIDEGGIAVGSRVIVQLGARKYYSGIVLRLHNERPDFKTIKTIDQIVDEQAIVTEHQLRLWRWISSYYMSPIGMVMRAAIPSGLKLDGYSIDETIRSGHSEKFTPHIILHPSIQTTEQLERILNSFGAAKGQYQAVTEYLYQAEIDAPTTPPVPIAKKNLKASDLVIKKLIDKSIFEIINILKPASKSSDEIATLPQLTPIQNESLESIKSQFAQKKVTLLHGITGSGKTEIYIHLIAEQLRAGYNVLYILPEIALTAQLIDRMSNYFGDAVIIYHSKVTDARRSEVYRTLLRSNCGRLIIGVRSSVLLPLRNISLIVVDEEHENSFKQSETEPRYNARDTALVLATYFGANTLLGSATPSIESYYNGVSGKYGLTSLQERYSGVALPQIVISDTLRAAKRGEKTSHFNKITIDKISEALQLKRQIILFQNRRGFSPYVECGNCGWNGNCPNCNVSLTYHKADGVLRCHYCGLQMPIPKICPTCQADDIQPKGFGTEKIEDELSAIFPDATIDRMDADTTRTMQSYRKIITAFEQGHTDILIGTQMITKGFDFGNVSLVSILNADNLLNYPDFRAAERAFSLMTQVGGRAGRREDQGLVIIQTSQPKHPILELIVKGDYDTMARAQLAERKAFLYPPYCRIINITLRHPSRELVWQGANNLANSLRTLFGRRVLGPEAPAVDRIRGKYMVQFMLKIEKERSAAAAKELLTKAINHTKEHNTYKNIEFLIDVDPL